MEPPEGSGHTNSPQAGEPSISNRLTVSELYRYVCMCVRVCLRIPNKIKGGWNCVKLQRIFSGIRGSN